MMRASLALLLPLALAACGGAEPAPESSETEHGLVADRFAGVTIILTADGLRAVDGGSMRFGASRGDTDALAAQAFGSPATTSANAECGAGPMEFSQYGALQIAYQDGRFAGWFLREGEGFATADGIRPGMAIDTLKGERPVREIDTTLPGEFEYTTAAFGTIRGFTEEGKITALQAGLSCFFR